MVTEENYLWTMKHESTRRTAEVKCESFKNDPDLFMYQYRGILHGIHATYVIKPLHKIFKIASVNKKAFWYLGLYLKERDNSIVIS